ncbi:MAG TPA: DUF2147 domain-containing protein [Microscillaceae bacterium]|nr:DUF2147 domain-containing protein [Microscillaceae bacterium]
MKSKNNIIRSITFLAAALFLMSTQAFSQDVVGTWKTIDDETGKARSHVKVWKNKKGVVFGRIVKILDPKKQNAKCDKCPDKREGIFGQKGEPIMNMVMMSGLTKDDDQYSGGRIFDPNKGKSYKCYIELKGADKLKVRGYIGSRYLGRTQYWYRVK